MDTATDTPPRRRGPKLPELALTEDERATLQRWARRAKSSQALALRCRILLACAEGVSNAAVAARLGISKPTVTKWRSRFVARRLEGLADEPRPGAARTITDDQVEQVLVMTLETTPADATHWSTRSLARQLGMSQSAISRIWRAFGLKPHLVDTFKLSTDPQFIGKVRDIVGLYLNPPEGALVLCVDEKSSIQALDRTAPILPLLPGVPQRQTHDYTRHGVTNLDAALDVASGKVISQMTARHRAVEFKRFLDRVDKAGPRRAGSACHLRQLLDPQDPRDPAVAAGPPPRAPPLHPDLRLLAEPGRALVRRADHQVAAPRYPPLGARTRAGDPGLDRGLEQEPSAVCVAQDRRRDPQHHRHLLPANQRLRTLGGCRSMR
jgi:transposase